MVALHAEFDLLGLRAIFEPVPKFRLELSRLGNASKAGTGNLN